MENPEIKGELYQIGKKTFLLTAIVPLIFTIFDLILTILIILEKGISYKTYNESDFGVWYGFLISGWLVTTLPLTITNVLGKKLLYTRHPKLIFQMPLLAIILTIIFLSLGIALTAGLTNEGCEFLKIKPVCDFGEWVLTYIVVAPFITGFNAIVSIIVSVILYKKHISKKVFDPSLT